MSGVSSGPIRVGIVGTGGWARAHAAAYKQISNVRLTACCDLNEQLAEAFAAEHGIEHVCTSVAELIEHVDAASVVTSDAGHAPVSLELLAADVHTLCEKPLATTLEDAKRVASAARSASDRGVVHMINFTKRSMGEVAAMIELVRSGALGEITHVLGGYQQSWLLNDSWGHWTSDSWLWRLLKPGGTLVDIGVHMLDMLTAVVGPVSRLRCDLRTLPKLLDGKRVSEYQGKQIDGDDIATQEIELASGGFAVLQQSRWSAGHHNREWLEVWGIDGAAWIDPEDHRGVIWTCLGATATQERRWERRMTKPVPTNQKRFIEAIAGGEQVQPDLVHGAEVQALLDACLRSADSGQWETPEAIV